LLKCPLLFRKRSYFTQISLNLNKNKFSYFYLFEVHSSHLFSNVRQLRCSKDHRLLRERERKEKMKSYGLSEHYDKTMLIFYDWEKIKELRSRGELNGFEVQVTICPWGYRDRCGLGYRCWDGRSLCRRRP